LREGSNNFWVYQFDDNYKYAKFNIYNSISDFVNIRHAMYRFLNQKRWLLDANLSANECVLNNSENYNQSYVTPKNIITNFDFVYKFIDFIFEDHQQNDYCIVINGLYHESYWNRKTFIYNRFLPDNHPDKWVKLIKGQNYGTYNKGDALNFKIYGNYIWYIHEQVNGTDINITFYARNIITGKIHKIYTYDDEYRIIWKNKGHWKFSYNNAGLIIYKKY